MKVLVTTHAQMFRTPDGKVWSNSVYGYKFFKRYLDVFERIRVISRIKEISYEDIDNKILASGPGIEFYDLHFYRGPWEYAKKYLFMRKKIKRAMDNCDCAILRIPDQLSFELFNVIKKTNKPCAVEVVAHSWDFYAPGNIKTILRPFLRFSWDINQKRLCKKALGVSYVTEKYIQKRYPSNIFFEDDSRFETFYTSADIDSAFFYRPRLKDSFQKKILNLIHVSGINNHAKGHDELIKVMLKLKTVEDRFRLTFVGDGILLNHFRNLVNSLGLNDKVEFIGYIAEPQKLASILKRADIFVFPSTTEGLPRVLLEAMATGLPCIATNVGGISEVLSSESLVKPKDEKDLLNKIIDFSSDIKLLEKESKNNYLKIVDMFLPETIQKKRFGFYSQLKKCSS